MDFRQLGRSGLRVSTITLGTMGFGGQGPFAAVGKLGVADCKRQLDLCLDAGVNLVDTANMYSRGASEEILGEAMSSHPARHDRLMIATKVRFAMGDGANDAGLSRHHVIASAEASLRRLRADHIDLLQLHEWDGQTPLEETLRALDDLVRAGKVRYVGCSNYTAWQMMKGLAVSEARGFERFVVNQIHYTPQAREAEFEILPAAIDQGVGTLIWSPIAGGLLSGKYRRAESGPPTPEGSRHLGDWGEPPVYDEDALYDLIDVLVEVGGAHGVSAAQVTLAWILSRPGVTSVIVGARTEEQLTDNLAAAQLSLGAEEIERIETVSRPPLPYPLWHQAANAADRLSPADLSVLSRHL
jgi:aryl-alcohol dehydrogenase-like predicted oxidoreductase